ncbi:endonuclease [Nitrosomonas halophila]|uniref:Deoxyribonuclease-1 n=1 Tax=Nitrosomonas halophila TaxID=44576 RepID=A0A1H3PMS7_9PROT|nr:endonuclease [Nitrosomonas halophila]SDZ02357.1 deoxyribonuclease-1 [Nitrosomonas halophila]
MIEAELGTIEHQHFFDFHISLSTWISYLSRINSQSRRNAGMLSSFGPLFRFQGYTQLGTNRAKESYCGCTWKWVGRSGGRVDLDSCGYEIRAQENRAIRTEWEHVVPASNFGRARQCWQNGGRKNCNNTDPVFNAMEADLHNLTPAIGEVNADRSNFRFGVLPNDPHQHGACDFKVDFKGRVAEPRNEIKGQIARIYFYMHDRYDLPMSRQQQQLLMAWDKQFPVNPFLTGARTWTLDHKNSKEGIYSEVQKAEENASGGVIRGNRSSKVYHLPQGCPSYDAMSSRNIVEFATEGEAIASGYRKAGNCR